MKQNERIQVLQAPNPNPKEPPAEAPHRLLRHQPHQEGRDRRGREAEPRELPPHRWNPLQGPHRQAVARPPPLPPRLLVAKNTLIRKAIIEGTAWEALKPCMKGMNAWMFVHDEEIPEAHLAFQKERKLEENDFTGAVFDWRFYGPDEFKALETMLSRAEISAKLLGTVQGPAVSLVSTLRASARPPGMW